MVGDRVSGDPGLDRRGESPVSEPRVLGVDPGFASIGAVVATPTRALHAEVIRTKRGRGRRAIDDDRRGREIFERLRMIAAEYQVGAVAAEVYVPFQGDRGEQATEKIAHTHLSTRGYQIALCVGYALDLPVHPIRPGEIRKAFRANSKSDVAAAACRRLAGLDRLLAQLRKTDRPHAGDAAGVGWAGSMIAYAERLRAAK